MSTDAILNQGEPNVILTAHATKVNRTEPNWTEPQTCLACQNHALSQRIAVMTRIPCALLASQCFYSNSKTNRVYTGIISL